MEVYLKNEGKLDCEILNAKLPQGDLSSSGHKYFFSATSLSIKQLFKLNIEIEPNCKTGDSIDQVLIPTSQGYFYI